MIFKTSIDKLKEEVINEILGAHWGNDELRRLVNQGYQAGKIQALQDEIKFLEPLKYCDYQEIKNRIKERISKLKGRVS